MIREMYLTRSCAVPATWHTKQIWISFVSFEFKATGVDAERALTLSGLRITDERRVRTGGLLDDGIWFGPFCGVLVGDDIGGDGYTWF